MTHNQNEFKEQTFTIIIPAYNSAAYIDKALNSIYDNNYSKNLFEVLVVDDGSNDDTQLKVQTLMQKHENLFLFKKTNGNWGSVINFVKQQKLIKNKYVVVLDSDDQLDKNFFKMVNKKIKNADVLMCGVKIQGKNFKYHCDPYWFFSRNLPNQQNRFTMSFVPFSIITKTDIFMQTIPLTENVSFQDTLLFYNILKIAKTVRWTSASAGYYWRSRPGNTMTSSWSEKRFHDETQLHQDLQKIDLAHHAIWRFLLNGYKQKAIEKQYKLELSKKPDAKCLPFWLRPIFWIMYLFYLKKLIKYVPKENQQTNSN
ncbi:glycosyltransferase [[Mycoplasma] testudinis]|uniref:glycosyltransferase n=1 Tax=[Mycoplasma] testudinis TaxID=33924 RepID=UPI000695C0BA|nr:glycosyltransferase family 2 protein [[Mycoplasma] testudinis]